MGLPIHQHSVRQQLIAAAQAMNASGINSGTAGNLSVRIEEADGWRMLITPSGCNYDLLRPEDIVEVTATGDWPEGQKPSSEWRIHHDIYHGRLDAAAIVHAHPIHCTALACLRRSIPAFHYKVSCAGGADIRCCGYATFGTQELSDQVLGALEDRKACLMANHGMVCLEASLGKALALAIEVETLANMYCQALSLGEPVILDDEEMLRVIEIFKDYGPK